MEAAVREELLPYLRAAGVDYPPETVVLLGLKHERRLELYAGPSQDRLRFVRDYPVLNASGALGPKRAEGDQQVPEGIYRLVGLNRNSRYHRSLELDYPNRFDREMARRDGRPGLGNEIFIHGGAASAGCLALGDRSAEELFVLANDTGIDKVTVILSPWDFRIGPPTFSPMGHVSDRPAWLDELYSHIGDALQRLPSPRW